MKRNSSICYACGKRSTSREHVPPISIFPEGKDMDGENLRKDLITVPSCDKHNSRKSKDDEFLMITLGAATGTNKYGFLHHTTKISRAIQRNEPFYKNKVLKEQKEILFETKNGKKIPLIIGKPDTSRLMRCFKQIGLGLYYNEFGKRFIGDIKVIMDFIIDQNDTMKQIKTLLKDQFEVEAEGLQIKGANSEIFNYCFLPPDQFGVIALKMVFYDGLEVYVGFKSKDAKEPFDLALMLALDGFETTITTAKGKKVHFNKRK